MPTKVHLVKAMVFPVVMYGCESWTVKKAEHRRIDPFELWSWKRLLRVPWTARRSNQSILKEISPGISLEGMMLKLKLQYSGHLMRRVDSLKKTLMLGEIGGRRRRGQTENGMAGWHHWLDGRESQWTPGVGDGQGGLACCDSWGRKEEDTTERLIWSDSYHPSERLIWSDSYLEKLSGWHSASTILFFLLGFRIETIWFESWIIKCSFDEAQWFIVERCYLGIFSKYLKVGWLNIIVSKKWKISVIR